MEGARSEGRRFGVARGQRSGPPGSDPHAQLREERAGARGFRRPRRLTKRRCAVPKKANPPLAAVGAAKSEQRSARQRSAFAQGLQLRPRDLRMRAAAEAAVAAGDDVFAADALGEALDALGYDLRVLDYVGGMRHDARDEYLPLRQANAVP